MMAALSVSSLLLGQTTSTSTQPKASKTVQAKRATTVKTVPPKPTPVATQQARPVNSTVRPVAQPATINRPVAVQQASTLNGASTVSTTTPTAVNNLQNAANTVQGYANQTAALSLSAYANQATNAAGNGNLAGATNGATATSGFAAGLGTFHGWDITWTAYNCLRSGTRVFCDFDLTKQNAASTNAWNGSSYIQVVGATGRVFGAHSASYVDTDGSTFQTANLNPNVPVRWVLEFDDVPVSYNQVTLAWGNDRIQSVPVTLIPDSQAANTMPLRQTGGTVQGQQASGASQQQVTGAQVQQIVGGALAGGRQQTTPTTDASGKPVKTSKWSTLRNAAQGAMTASQNH